MAIGDALIGALRVTLGLDTAQLEDGVKKANKALSGFEKSINTMSGGLLNFNRIIGLVASGAFVAFLKTSAKVGEDIEKGAKRLGISTDAFQEWSYAATLAGVSQESLTNALNKLQKGLGGTDEEISKTEKALARLGISADDFKKLAPEKQFLAVSDGLSRLTDASQRARIGADLMGKAYGEVDAVFSLGSPALRAIADEAHRFGLILSKETVEAAGKADDEFDRMGAALKVAGVNITAGFLPGIEAISKIFTSQGFQDGVKNVAENIGKLVKYMADNQQVVAGFAAAIIGLRIGALVNPIVGAAGALIGFVAGTQAATPELKLLQNALEGAMMQTSALKDELQRLKDQADKSGTGEFDAAIAKTAISLRDSQEKVKSLSKAIDELTGANERFKVNIPKPPPESILDPETAKKIDEGIGKINFQAKVTAGAFGTELNTAFMQSAVSIGLYKVQTDGTTEAVKGLTTQEQLLRDAQLKLNQAQAVAPLVKFTQDIQNVGKSISEFAVSSLNNMSSSLADVITGAKSASEGWKDFAKAVVKALVQMLVQMLIVLPIATALKAAIGGPLGFISSFFGFSGGGVLPGGAALGQGGIGSAAGGASWTVPGGSMGVDTQFYGMALAPGERVDITPAAKVNDQSGILTIQGVGPKDFFTGDMVRQMIVSIDQWMRDGGTGIRMVPR